MENPTTITQNELIKKRSPSGAEDLVHLCNRLGRIILRNTMPRKIKTTSFQRELSGSMAD
jgi:hypothetical protein